MSGDRLLWVDLETTGIERGPDSAILEIAAFITDPGGTRIGAPFHAIRRLEGDASSMYELGGVSFEPGAYQMHAVNGLLSDCRESPLTASLFNETVKYWINFMAAGERLQCAGNSVHFDRDWLLASIPGIAGSISHRVLDVTSLMTFARAAGWPRPEAPESNHRAIGDISRSFATYQTYLDLARGTV